jgi:hypothetical protein
MRNSNKSLDSYGDVYGFEVLFARPAVDLGMDDE